jgi:hypothetical protein
MIKFVEGRSVNPGEKVEIYFNIQKGGFSIVSRDKSNPNKGRVCAHVSNAQIENATFHINDKKFAAIGEKGKKHVYAIVKGTLVGFDNIGQAGMAPGYCNPQAQKEFINFDTKEIVTKAKIVNFYDRYFSYQA